jgi:hypothetical protein
MSAVASIDLATGTITFVPGHTIIVVGNEFNWTTNASGNITVSTPTGSAWFTPSSKSFTGPGSVTVTAAMESVGVGWTYNVTGLNRGGSNPHIPIGGRKP